jgi:hypothetical protein
MDSVDLTAILHIKIQFFKRERILVFEMMCQDFRTEEKEMLEE